MTAGMSTVIFTLLGGLFAIRSGVIKAMFVSGILMASTNLLFSLLAWYGKSELLFAIAVIFDDIAAAFATVAFVAFISMLVDRTYTATQYALLASIGTLGRTTLASSSGSLVDYLNGDWGLFFVITSVMVIPSLILIFFLKEKIKALNYHITLSHGSKEDTFSKALELGLNYAAAFNLKKSQNLPTTFKYRGKSYKVTDGDITDARFMDDNKTTNIIGLRFKIVVNKDNANKLAFCIA